jgi:hypothetical protein
MTVSADVIANEGLIRVDGRWIDDPDFDPFKIIRPEDEEQEGEATARKRVLAAADSDEETRQRALDTAGDLVRVVNPDGSARWVESSRAGLADDAEMESLLAEARNLEELSNTVILAPAAKKRLEEIPGLMAAIQARKEEAARAKDVDDTEFREHYDGAMRAYIESLRAMLDAKEVVNSIRAAAMARGVYLTKLEVLAHEDRELHALLIRVRGTALA